MDDLYDPATGELLKSKDEMMKPEDAAVFEAHGVHKVYARTVLGCRAKSGVCAKCYGMNLATSELVNLGEAVGIIAAQSIGEPGTQLTMRTFHTGGVAGDDITQGLPRVEELFEARKPKKMATLAEIGGRVRFEESAKGSLLTCESSSGVCSKCYGINLAIGEAVGEGEAVGIIAAQSIGEPGTQLTMRTFHTGGVAGGDITQGLPRVEELFEARRPKKMAQLAEISGKVSMEDAKKGGMVNVTITATDGEVVTYTLAHNAGIRVKEGDSVTKGDMLTDGALYPADVLRIRGIHAVYDYLIQEVQKPYRQQGVDINDKHIEVIARQMMRKVRVEDAGDSDLLSGSTIDLIEFKDAERAVQARIDAGETNDGLELKLPVATRLIMGITKASLATESFLSAASFQETTKVLTEAAIKGKVDHLLGLKENVIIGKLIPAGSGLARYRQFDWDTMSPDDEPSEPPVEVEEGPVVVDEDPAAESDPTPME